MPSMPITVLPAPRENPLSRGIERAGSAIAGGITRRAENKREDSQRTEDRNREDALIASENERKLREAETRRQHELKVQQNAEFNKALPMMLAHGQTLSPAEQKKYFGFLSQGVSIMDPDGKTPVQAQNQITNIITKKKIGQEGNSVIDNAIVNFGLNNNKTLREFAGRTPDIEQNPLATPEDNNLNFYKMRADAIASHDALVQKNKMDIAKVRRGGSGGGMSKESLALGHTAFRDNLSNINDIEDKVEASRGKTVTDPEYLSSSALNRLAQRKGELQRANDDIRKKASGSFEGDEPSEEENVGVVAPIKKQATGVTPVQQAKYDAFISQNPNATREEKQAFIDTLGS